VAALALQHATTTTRSLIQCQLKQGKVSANAAQYNSKDANMTAKTLVLTRTTTATIKTTITNMVATIRSANQLRIQVKKGSLATLSAL